MGDGLGHIATGCGRHPHLERHRSHDRAAHDRGRFDSIKSFAKGTIEGFFEEIGEVGITTAVSTSGQTPAMTIGGKVYRFQSVLTDIDGNIAIGTLTATRLNIVAAINATLPSGTQYAASTLQHPTVSAAIAR